MRAARAMVIDGLAAAVATILPLNGSTNVFVDLAGQTLANGIVEGARKPFNVWARGNGFRDDLLASLPPSVRPYARIGECFDACAPIECNVAGVLTAGGGYVIPGQIVKTGTLTSGSQYVLGDTGAAMGINDYKGLILVMTSGAAAGSTFPIRDNTAIEFRSAEGMSSGVPSAGDTYRIVRVVKREYLHLTSWGEELVAAAMAPILARYIRI
ncbi:hypothetical protein EON81_07245 [bacterium]|nr:MAG: hypothetical protein EON81_07245 [bacterium]